MNLKLLAGILVVVGIIVISGCIGVSEKPGYSCEKDSDCQFLGGWVLEYQEEEYGPCDCVSLVCILDWFLSNSREFHLSFQEHRLKGSLLSPGRSRCMYSFRKAAVQAGGSEERCLSRLKSFFRFLIKISVSSRNFRRDFIDHMNTPDPDH